MSLCPQYRRSPSDLPVILCAAAAKVWFEPDLPSAAIGRHALVWNPHVFRHGPSLPEHIDRDAATWIPIATDPQPLRIEQVNQTPCN
jgi:hypothetical protein